MKAYLPLLIVFIAYPAMAHLGHDTESFQAGLLHTMTGCDHLLILSGAGVLATVGNKSPKLFLITALLAMAFGAFFGQIMGSFIDMELMIALSLVVSGALLLSAISGKSTWAMPLIALAHGWAHGAEGNVDGFWMFFSGLLISSSVLLLGGYGVGLLLRRHPYARKIAGSAWLIAAAAAITG